MASGALSPIGTVRRDGGGQGPAAPGRSIITLRPIANPLPLGFLALAGGTTLVSGLQLGWVPATDGHQVALILLAFVAPLQLLAAILGFFGRDVAGIVGLALAALAGYTALAMELEDARQRTVLPIGRRRQEREVEGEAGVRPQL